MAYEHRYLVRLFEEDPDLLRWVEARHAAIARREVVVDAVALERGVWEPRSLIPRDEPPPTALLILEGFLTRSVNLHGRTGTELLGPGDVLTPWAPSGLSEYLDAQERWRVLQPTRVAILERRFETFAARLPGVMSELVCRHGRRARSIAMHRALMQVPGLPNRLRLLLWSIGERWGRVLPDGLIVPVRLSHGALADLIGAQRPSVTLGLQRLVQLGLLERHTTGGWLLSGPPPAEAPTLPELERTPFGRRVTDRVVTMG